MLHIKCSAIKYVKKMTLIIENEFKSIRRYILEFIISITSSVSCSVIQLIIVEMKIISTEKCSESKQTK